MERVNYATVLASTLAMVGNGATESRTDVARFREFHSERLRSIWHFARWPELMRIEQRQFRQSWSSAATYAAGDERFYPPSETYYVALQASTGEAPADEDGDENSAYWAELGASTTTRRWETGLTLAVGDRVLNPSDLLTYQCHTAHTTGATFDSTKFGEVPEFIRDVDKEQAWESTTIGDVTAVWDRNPRTQRNPKRLDYEVENDRVIVLAVDVPRPWIEYRQQCPSLTGADYSSTAAYAADDQVYYSSATAPGNFYDVVSATTAGDTPESAAAKFSLVEIPRAFAGYLISGAYADWLAAEGEPEERRAIANSRAEQMRGAEWHRASQQLNQNRGWRVTTR